MDTYEKKYNEALAWMRKLYPGLHGATKEDAEHYFPELRESEDEVIRKAIKCYVEDMPDTYGFAHGIGKKEMLAYLEKQKDKMTAEEFESSELFQLKLKTKYANGYQDGLAQKEQKPAEWSEEDEKKLEDLTSLLAILEGCSTVNVGTAAKYNGWLKSFRSRPKSSDNWKPSEKQINALQDSIDLDKTVLRRGRLIGLLEDLKGLM